MTQKSLFAVVLLLVAFVVAWAEVLGAGIFQQLDPPKKVKRVKRPVFTNKDTSGIYFDNVFEQAIVGARPTNVPSVSSQAGVPNASTSESEGGGDFVWSAYISGDVIEAEIKRLQRELAKQVTSPGKYKTEYQKARYSFEMLSMLFGIILEHDQEVRWKRVAGLAQPSFAVAAKNARRGDGDSYKYAVARRDDLQELVRGGNMSSNEKPVESFEWGDVVGRGPIMNRLQDSVDLIKPWLASKEEFEANKEEILHEASLVAAMAEILTRESMDDALEDDYVDYSKTMRTGALAVMESIQLGGYDAASAGFNQISQSCSNCHDDWR